MRKSFPFFFLLMAFAFSATAQDDIPFDDLPPTTEYGKCYAKCKIPDQYETVEVQVLVSPERTTLSKVPAQYETITEQVLVKEGGVNYKTIPATFRTVEEQVMVEPERTRLKTIPAQYRTESYQVLVSEARGQWTKKKKSPNCFSSNPDDCYVVCWEEIPAQYRTETRTITVSEATTAETVIPAVYKTVKRRQLVSPETVTQNLVPAKYTTKKERRLVKQGGFTVWTEILCESKTTSGKVSAVQTALKERGYDPGPIDGVMGIQTQAAMKQYQTDNGLPVGNMNLETLKSLKVDYN